MVDSDEEDFVALGTPFEQLEEDAPRKKPVPIHEQIVTDDHGRRRFHGAFTGGFSAGYFNTVDTVEGWTPKTFVSSRLQKATERTTQRPEDFMDEEDLSEFGIAPKRIVTTQKFLPTKKDASDGKPNSSGTGPTILAEKLLQDLIVPVKMSVGVKLLSQMGWKEGQGVGPRVRRTAKKTYGCIGPNNTASLEGEEDIFAVGLFFAPKDVDSLEFTSKDDFHGIGYSGIDPKTAVISQRDWLRVDQRANSIGIRGQGFGVGALEEEDDDIYGQDNLSNYDIVLSTSKSQKKHDLHGWTGPQQSSGKGGMLSLFCKASQPPPARKHYPPPVVPRDFKPVHQVEETKTNKQTLPGQAVKQPQNMEKENQRSKRLTAKERGEALGETPLPTPKKSIFDYIAEEDKTRLKESKKKANVSKECIKEPERHDLSRRFTSRGPISSSGFKPFASNLEKQARYEQYLSGKSDTFVSSGSKRTEWERECELDEFSRAATLYRPLSQTMAARFISAKDPDEKSSVEDKDCVTDDQSGAAKMKMFGALTRERFEWHPNKILCKRFNIPDPYPGAGVDGVVRDPRANFKTEVSVKKEVKAIDYKPQSSTDSQSLSSTQHDEAEMIDKPSALVAGFQSIVSQSKQHPNLDTGSYSGDPVNEEQKTDKQNTESDENVINRAPMDLFNEIFAESSSESDSESEEDEETEQSKSFESNTTGNVERNDRENKGDNTRPANDAPIPVPERNTPVEAVERESSPETFGPALPTSFGGNLLSTKELQSSVRVDSPGRREKQKPKKKKKRKDKESDSDNDGFSRSRKDKRNKKKDITDSDEEYKSKKRNKNREFTGREEEGYNRRKKGKKKTREKDAESDLTNSESEGPSRQNIKKAKQKYHSDSGDTYSKRKKGKKREFDNSDDSNNDEYVKRKKNKRKDKDKSVKEREKYTKKHSKTKRPSRQENNEYEPEEYVERVTHNVTSEKYSRTLDSAAGSRSSVSKRENYREKEREDMSKKDDTAKNIKGDTTDSKELEISRVPDSKEILNKLTNIQTLKEKKRMRAVDFM